MCFLWGWGDVGDPLGCTGEHWSKCSYSVKAWGFSYSIEQWNNFITHSPLETAWWLLNKIITELQPFIGCFMMAIHCINFYVHKCYNPFSNIQTQILLSPFHRQENLSFLSVKRLNYFAQHSSFNKIFWLPWPGF